MNGVAERFKKAGIPRKCPKCDGPLDVGQVEGRIELSCMCGWRDYISYLQGMSLMGKEKFEAPRRKAYADRKEEQETDPLPDSHEDPKPGSRFDNAWPEGKASISPAIADDTSGDNGREKTPPPKPPPLKREEEKAKGGEEMARKQSGRKAVGRPRKAKKTAPRPRKKAEPRKPGPRDNGKGPGTGFGERLSGLLKEKGISNYRLAKDLGINESAVRHWKKDASEPRGDTLLRMAEYLGVTPAWLRFGEPGPAPEKPKREGLTMVVDFTGYSDLLDRLEGEAIEEFRSPGLQVLAILNDHFDLGKKVR